MPETSTRYGARIAAIAAILFAALTLGAYLAAAPVKPASSAVNTPLVVRVYYEELHDLIRLNSYDVWEYNNLQERYVLVALDYADYQSLVSEGWRTAIDPSATSQLPRRVQRSTGFYGSYRTVAELYAEMEEMNQASPQLTEMFDYGRSHCLVEGGCVTLGGDTLPGFPLRALRVTNELVPGSSTINGTTITRGTKPIFFLIANIHAREITTPEIAMRYLETLLDEYDTEADISWLVDHHEIWVIPTVNPDGHWLVELGENPDYGSLPFYQRKNAQNDGNNDGEPDCAIWPPASFGQYGIDLNRNHSFGWGPPGSSSEPCDLTFRGLSAASEPEVASLEDLIRALIPDQRGASLTAPAPDDTTGLLITLHSYSNLVLWPWGNLESLAPNYVGLKAIGDKFATYNGYLSCQPVYCLYLTNGSSDDWAYGELGIPAFTFELGDEFMPPYAEIDNRQWPDNAPALFYAAKIARTPYLTAHGPDSLSLVVSGSGSPLTITATIDDRDNGGNIVASGVYSVDTPPWQENAVLTPLLPVDGVFDAAVEEVTGSLNTSNLSPGRHLLFIQGTDDAGNTGAVSAEYFQVAGVDLTNMWFAPLVLTPGNNGQ